MIHYLLTQQQQRWYGGVYACGGIYKHINIKAFTKCCLKINTCLFSGNVLDSNSHTCSSVILHNVSIINSGSLISSYWEIFLISNYAFMCQVTGEGSTKQMHCWSKEIEKSRYN